MSRSNALSFNARASRFDEPFAAQLELSQVHPQLVPMQRRGVGYVVHPSAQDWLQLPSERGFAGFGLSRSLRMLLDAMAGLCALHETRIDSGERFAHGEFAPLHFRIDPRGVCRLVPLTVRHFGPPGAALPRHALGYLSPERLIWEQISPRADVFSAGILLWEALACRRLFVEDCAETIIDRLMNEPLRAPPVTADCGWAVALEADLERALQVNVQRRSLDCSELAEAIARAARDRLPGHGEIAAFFAGSGLPMPAARPLDLTRTLASMPESRPPHESATFAKRKLPRVTNGVAREPITTFRFTTLRMSAVELRQNGLIDPNESSSELDRSLLPSLQASPPPSEPRVEHLELAILEDVSPPRRSVPPPLPRRAASPSPALPGVLPRLPPPPRAPASRRCPPPLPNAIPELELPTRIAVEANLDPVPQLQTPLPSPRPSRRGWWLAAGLFLVSALASAAIANAHAASSARHSARVLPRATADAQRPEAAILARQPVTARVPSLTTSPEPLDLDVPRKTNAADVPRPSAPRPAPSGRDYGI